MTPGRPQKAHIRKQEALLEFNKVIDSLQPDLLAKGYVIKTPIWENLSLENMPNEQWIDIVGYAGYMVSNYGRIKSVLRWHRKSDKILRQYFEAMGYLYVSMKDKKEKVHRISGFSFLKDEMSSEKWQINHLKGYKWYNVLFNLEWSTPGDNQRHAFANGLKHRRMGKYNYASIPIIQYDLNGKYITEWECMRRAAEKLNIDDSPIAKCCKGNINYKQAYGFLWRFKSENNSKKDLPPNEIIKSDKPKFFKRRETTNRLKKIA